MEVFKVLSQLVELPTDHVFWSWLAQDADQVGIGSCAILGDNIETNWVTFTWRFFALNAESQCSWAAVPGQLGLCATLGENTETNLVTFAWRLVLSMLRDSVRGLP